MGQAIDGIAGGELCSADALKHYEAIKATEINASQPLKYSQAAWEPKRPPAGANLRGTLEIRGSQAVGAKTRLAVAEALASVARRGQSRRVAPKGQDEAGGINVEVARSPLQPGAPEDTLRFTYAVRLSSSDEEKAVRIALEKEAAGDGKHRLLPRFFRSLKSHGEECEASPELRVTEWTVESSLAPRVDADVAALAARAKSTDPLLFEITSSSGPLLAGCAAARSPENMCTVVVDGPIGSAERPPGGSERSARSRCCQAEPAVPPEQALPPVVRQRRPSGVLCTALLPQRPPEPALQAPPDEDSPIPRRHSFPTIDPHRSMETVTERLFSEEYG